MRVVVTGQTGQVAGALSEAGPGRSVEIVCLGRPALDLLMPQTILPALEDASPDVIVNAAAYTAVDKAERDAADAHAINATGAGLVASAASQLGIPIIQLSTDYVFDGAMGRPYVETDAPHPLNVYGRSKLEGEALVAAGHADHAILRTAWVYSASGNNFLKTMLSLARTREAIAVVADQRGCPSSAMDLAQGILTVARNLVGHPGEAHYRGVFHMAGEGEASWADFAEGIFAASRAAGGPSAQVDGISTSQFPTPARRPPDTRLDCAKLATVHGVALPEWRSSVAAIVRRHLSHPNEDARR